MPAQDKLIRKLNENPPDNFAELEEMMTECGYGVTVTDPGAADGGEYSEEEEAAEDKAEGEEGEEGEEEAEGSPDDPMAMMQDLMPPGMAPPSENENPRMKVRRMTMVAARKALPKDDEGVA
jgi:hypothetical protein